MSYFRDGVSESQFNQVLNVELNQIIEVSSLCFLKTCFTGCNSCWFFINLTDWHFQACKFLDEKWSPKFAVIVAQKNHHTKFFQSGSPDNVPPGEPFHNFVQHKSITALDITFENFLFMQELLLTTKSVIQETMTSTFVPMLEWLWVISENC